ncbi:RISC-loading complex subunit tarbp2-like isoform X2 [Xenia sp. Carnegie-2017]|uniref:RISC-loading complex subunit tarbp2-like isoform X2 n=1 Tax=Xenia sp. Carnegie-2017 TaxID=2897299 RepID=UPI001F03A819|nr:RISC-loading complex subunit tarbp2-like isoform X2 [Xenia sp. Carnegie-2017]
MMSDLQCTGVGSSKKAAKKQAAEKILDLLHGYGDDDEGYGCDEVDIGTLLFNKSPSSSNTQSSPEILNDSALEEYNSSSSEISTLSSEPNVTKLTGSLSDSLWSASSDSKSLESREAMKAERQCQSSGDHLVAGIKGLGMGFMGDLTSIVTQPTEGANEKGVPGFFQGIGKGILGTYAKPTADILDLASGVSAAVHGSARRSSCVYQPKHVCSIRNCFGPGGAIPRYSKTNAEGQSIVMKLNENNMDKKMAHRTLNRERAREFLRNLKTDDKTPVSLVMELATQMGMVADFKEAKDLIWSNTPFKNIVKLGDLQAVGVAGSKKEAKQNSAWKLIKLIESESKDPLTNPTPNSTKVKTPGESPFLSPISLATGSSPETPSNRNTIGELQNLAASRKWSLPVYEFCEPTGLAHSKTFTCLVKMMSDLQCTGVGSSKKAAKKQAAEKMLDLLHGYGDDDEGYGCDEVDIGTLLSNKSPSSSNTQSSPEILNDSDLEDYNSSGSEISTLSSEPNVTNACKDNLLYDNYSIIKLESLRNSQHFKSEFIPLPSKSKKGFHQVFLKLTFDSGQVNYPIVTHGSGETEQIAKSRAAERAYQHLQLLMKVPH